MACINGRRGRLDKKVGQPGVRDGQGYKYRFGAILERPNDDDISGRQTPKDLVIGCEVLKRLSEHDGKLSPGPEKRRLRPEEGGGPNGLTSIHARIHWPATPDTVDGENELDDITLTTSRTP